MREATARAVKRPDASHPITIAPYAGRVRVVISGTVIAETSRALKLDEGGYKPVLYIPRQDVRMALLKRTTHSTYCPYKGDCSYFTIVTDGRQSENAGWSYESPFEDVAVIKDCLAFYPDRVDSIEV